MSWYLQRPSIRWSMKAESVRASSSHDQCHHQDVEIYCRQGQQVCGGAGLVIQSHSCHTQTEKVTFNRTNASGMKHKVRKQLFTAGISVTCIVLVDCVRMVATGILYSQTRGEGGIIYKRAGYLTGVLNDLFSQIAVLMPTAPSYKSEQMVRTDIHSDNSGHVQIAINLQNMSITIYLI